MSSKLYKCCAVPECKNTTIKTPGKLFIYVPKNKKIRKKWLSRARRNPTSISPKSSIYFCEDHFDLPNDMENYIQYHVMGSVSQVSMKPGCIPTRFECQSDRRKRTSTTTVRPYILKKQRQMLIEECEKYLEKSSTITKRLKPEKTPSGSSAPVDQVDENVRDSFLCTVTDDNPNFIILQPLTATYVQVLSNQDNVMDQEQLQYDFIPEEIEDNDIEINDEFSKYCIQEFIIEDNNIETNDKFSENNIHEFIIEVKEDNNIEINDAFSKNYMQEFIIEDNNIETNDEFSKNYMQEFIIEVKEDNNIETNEDLSENYKQEFIKEEIENHNIEIIDEFSKNYKQEFIKKEKEDNDIKTNEDLSENYINTFIKEEKEDNYIENNDEFLKNYKQGFIKEEKEDNGIETNDEFSKNYRQDY